MSGDWRRLHQVRGVCGGSPENHRVTGLSHKDKDEDRVWLSGQNRPDWFGEPI
jgi:predicted secreted hydrolase